MSFAAMRCALANTDQLPGQIALGYGLVAGGEPVFEDAARLLRQSTGAELALVSLWDGAHAHHVAGDGWGASGDGIGAALCAEAVAHGDEVVVFDASRDPRLCHHPDVTGEPSVRACAAAPVLMPDGRAAGAVVVADAAARAFSEQERAALAAVARQLSSYLELRRRLEAQGDVDQRLAHAEERLGLLAEAACEGMWELDLDLRSLSLSPRLFAMLSITRISGNVPLSAAWKLLHPDDRRRVQRDAIRTVRAGAPLECELRVRHPRDGWRWVYVRAVAAGSDRLVGSVVDVHERRQSQDRLRRVTGLLEESQALARVGGWELELPSEALSWTEETYRIHETSPEDLHLDVDAAIAFFAPAGRAELRAAIDDAMHKGRAFSLELPLVTARGRNLWVQVTGSAEFVNGRASRVLGALQDVSGQRRLGAELVEAKEAAEAASDAKSAFLAAMSHEIRTPMHTVLGYADMLRDSHLDDEQRECVDVITTSGRSLLRLIDDILDFSKVEAGKIELAHQLFDLREVADQVSRMMRPQAATKALTVEVLGADSVLVMADPQRVRQVLVNLAGNAVKFTGEGSVTIVVTRRRGFARCAVQDTGIGIGAEEQARLFDRFVQADASTTRNFGGTGLGLAISKELVEAMGGKVGVESEVGVGSTFWFEVPVAEDLAARVRPAVELVEAPSVVEESSVGGRVLVVEDNRLNLRLAVHVLENAGYEVVSAVDGGAALELVAAEQFDLVLMDCLMPGVDGFEATRRIRLDEAATGEHLPIVALTANAMPEDREACLAAGMDDFVAKPFTRQALKAAAARWVLRRG